MPTTYQVPKNPAWPNRKRKPRRVSLLDTGPPSGGHFWYANRANYSDLRLARPVEQLGQQGAGAAQARLRTAAPYAEFLVFGFLREQIDVRYLPEFVAIAVREWLGRLEVGTLFIEPGSPWENGYCESFNAKLRDELLNGEIFYSLAEAGLFVADKRTGAVRQYFDPGFGVSAEPTIDADDLYIVSNGATLYALGVRRL